MNVLIVFSFAIALCAASVIPPIPEDNSHYVEGVSRYIWMPDGYGEPHLVDLEAPVETYFLSTLKGEDNTYWLYTMENPSSPQQLILGDETSILNSLYDAKLPLKVLVHGWNGKRDSSLNPQVKQAFLDIADVNVIVVDWSRLAGRFYTTSVRGCPSVGKNIYEFLQFLLATAGADLENIHLVGFSLGAHIVGMTGRHFDGRVKRVTGLDPAGPLWGNNKNALNTESAQHVEAIHTNGALNGIFDNIAHADFYPNGGRNQPGCLLPTCSHSRAYELYAATVIFDHLVANQCSSLWQAQRERCSGDNYNMGNGDLNKEIKHGIFGLSTRRSWPY